MTVLAVSPHSLQRPAKLTGEAAPTYSYSSTDRASSDCEFLIPTDRICTAHTRRARHLFVVVVVKDRDVCSGKTWGRTKRGSVPRLLVAQVVVYVCLAAGILWSVGITELYRELWKLLCLAQVARQWASGNKLPRRFPADQGTALLLAPWKISSSRCCGPGHGKWGFGICECVCVSLCYVHDSH